MPSSSCFYLYTENLSLLVLLPIFAYKKDTCPNSASVLTVSLYNHISISYKNYRNLFRSHTFSIYGNGSNRLTWSNFLTLAPSGFASLLFSKFAFKYFFAKIKYHEVFYTSIMSDRKSVFLFGF